MFTLKDAFFALVLIALLILVGRFIKQKVFWLQKLYLPESIVAGVVALLLGPEVLGAIVTSIFGSDTLLSNGVFSEPIRLVWSQAPGVFINVVFAALFLGESIPSLREIWQKAAPQVVFGQTLAWGQYVTGILVTMLVLTPFFGLNPIAGSLIEIAFEGGHGTAGGMAKTFVKLGFEEGADLALGLATVGIVSAIIIGTILANWGRKKGYIPTVNQEAEEPDELPELHSQESPHVRRRRSRLMRDLLIDPLSLNLGFVGIAIVLGWLILEVLTQIEALTWGKTGFQLMIYVPLFPMALIGGILLQLVMERRGLSPLIIEPLMKNIAGVALDVVIVAALASISLSVLGSNLAPFLILSVVGITWNVLAFIYLAPRLIPSYWFERGIGDMGQSMGVTATGILLLRMVDPDNRSGAFESFAYKQLFFEPIVGGGLFTAAAPALLAKFGSVTVLLITGGLLAFWLVMGFFVLKPTWNGNQNQ
ncbi:MULTISPECIES: sodium/glutamate symporter [unclassified Coleofasciculus]|uniref:sodium/glutamate symporter n=1 Tax=unclassified Coleofasciculus TaxID=2692782 RepID=UPI0018807F89|nr:MULTISPECIES: sodium/glutamate symporter [unclassified Coleofasciculus]MBE9129523.1 sodium:glutamate symporter [Coleofasciculus sp. LEGE 07081]MBE9151362.1 sodium:glutamate symporter [Coleofasciculus sp. LEGE 07092]